MHAYPVPGAVGPADAIEEDLRPRLPPQLGQGDVRQKVPHAVVVCRRAAHKVPVATRAELGI